MRKKQRIIEAVKKAKRENVLGAARTAAIDNIKHEYGHSEGMLRAICLFHSGADYWNA